MALKISSIKFVIRSRCAMAEPISWNGMTAFFKLEFIFSVVATTFHLTSQSCTFTRRTAATVMSVGHTFLRLQIIICCFHLFFLYRFLSFLFLMLESLSYCTTISGVKRRKRKGDKPSFYTYIFYHDIIFSVSFFFVFRFAFNFFYSEFNSVRW